MSDDGSTTVVVVQPAPPPPSVLAVGIFEDGTRADWKDDLKGQTAVQRLAKRYVGPKIYKGGPGTDERGAWLKAWETVLGKGRRARFEDFVEFVKLNQPDDAGSVLVVDLFGWSRGGDEMIAFCDEVLKLGVAVRFLGVFDPVPARGLKAALRIIPFLKLPTFYNRPNVGSVGQVLAAENHSRITRHARIKIDRARDAQMYVDGSHRDAAGYAGAYPEAERFMETCAAAAGVVWRPAASAAGN